MLDVCDDFPTLRKKIEGNNVPIEPADIAFNEQGTPISKAFDDVYFSNDNGVKESQYVFQHHNHLPQRWLTHAQSEFVILETGFGTGLNFLLAYQAYLAQQEPLTFTLHFISTEKYPIAKSDLIRALQQWPELSALTDELIAQYPMPETGCHRLIFAEGMVVLDLWIGDLLSSLPQISCPANGLVDAWYLDGFAPSKNPEMWHANLFEQMTRLSKHGTTAATFTSAGLVKRGLISAGFKVKKVPGFGRKREMLTANFEPKLPPSPNLLNLVASRCQGPWQRGSSNQDTVAIIGGGIAAASLAASLVEKGRKVQLYWREKHPAQGASGNVIGGFYPHLTADHSLQAQFYVLAFQFALNRYKQLLDQGFKFDHEWCGVFFPSFSEAIQKRHRTMREQTTWSNELIAYVEKEVASSVVGIDMPYPGMFIPHGGWINPPSLVKALIEQANQSGKLSIFPEHELKTLKKDGKWEISWTNGQCHSADSIVLATGFESMDIPQLQGLPFAATRGQVEHLSSPRALQNLKSVICHKGYLTPACQGINVMGSTYTKQDTQSDYRGSESIINQETLERALPDCIWPKELRGNRQGRAAIRSTTPDHLPIVGAVPDLQAQKTQFSYLSKDKTLVRQINPADHSGLFVFAGLGSRGLCTAPILAELLASQICASPLPLSMEMQAMLNPNRFLIRELIRKN